MCVLHPCVPAVEVCLISTGGRVVSAGVERDFCGECIEEGRNEDNFGRCYECKDGLHFRCVGVPCQCDCPPTPIQTIDQQIARAEEELTRLKAQRDKVVARTAHPSAEVIATIGNMAPHWAAKLACALGMHAAVPAGLHRMRCAACGVEWPA